MKDVFNNKKIWTTTKARAFDTYISSTFLYNACLWTLTKTQETKIDAFQRRLIRSNVLNIRWPQKIRNEDVYKKSKIQPWSKRIKKLRMTWFGHAMRLPSNTPAKRAIEYAKTSCRAPRGRPKLTWIKQMTQQLEEDMNMTWEEAERKAQEKTEWRREVYLKYK